MIGESLPWVLSRGFKVRSNSDILPSSSLSSEYGHQKLKCRCPKCQTQGSKTSRHTDKWKHGGPKDFIQSMMANPKLKNSFYHCKHKEILWLALNDSLESWVSYTWLELEASLLWFSYTILSGPHIMYCIRGPCSPHEPQSNVVCVSLLWLVSSAVCWSWVSLVCAHVFTYVWECVHIKIQPLMQPKHVEILKTTTCFYLTNKAVEADSVSSQLTAPPPPLLPLLLFHCVNMTEPPLVIWSWRQMELVSVTSAAQQDKWANSSHWWSK